MFPENVLFLKSFFLESDYLVDSLCSGLLVDLISLGTVGLTLIYKLSGGS